MQEYNLNKFSMVLQKMRALIFAQLFLVACSDSEPSVSEARTPNPTPNTVYEEVDPEVTTFAQFCKKYHLESMDSDYVELMLLDNCYYLTLRVIPLYNKTDILGKLTPPIFMRINADEGKFFSHSNDSPWVKWDAHDDFFALQTREYDYSTHLIGFCGNYGEYTFRIEYYHPTTDRYFATPKLLLTLSETDLINNNIQKL